MAETNHSTRNRMLFVIFGCLIVAAVLIYALLMLKNNQNYTFQEPKNGPPKQYNPTRGPLNK